MDYSVELKNVSKVIGNNLIIDDVSFHLEKGKIYGLVGANGSGKSTILKIILGLYKSKGEVFINGKNLNTNFNECLKDIGGIVDYVSFYDYLSAYENLRYFALLYGVSFDRIVEVMDLVNLKINDKKIVKKFSLGMKQRLGIAISLLKDPSILILDEPTNGLDPRGVRDFRNLLLSLKDKTIIISSHLISEIEKISDEVIFISNKKIYQKSIDKSNEEKNIRFRLDDYEKATDVLNVPLYDENSNILMNDDDVAISIKDLVNADIPIYRVEEVSCLEDTLISMIDKGDGDD
jgi:ABC-2 type transport system ATP-binding protein